MQEINKKVEVINNIGSVFQQDLFKRPIFRVYSSIEIISNTFNNLNIEENRYFIGKCFLIEKYKAIVSHLLDIIINYKADIQYFWSDYFFEIVNKIIIEYEINFKLKLIEKYGDKIGNKIYKVVYNDDNQLKQKKKNHNNKNFKEIHEDSILFIKSWIKEQNVSNLNGEWKIKTFIDLCFIAYKLAFSQMEKRLSVLNGELSELLEEFERNNSLNDNKLTIKEQVENLIENANIKAAITLLKTVKMDTETKNILIIIISSYHSLKQKEHILNSENFDLELKKINNNILNFLNILE